MLYWGNRDTFNRLDAGDDAQTEHGGVHRQRAASRGRRKGFEDASRSTRTATRAWHGMNTAATRRQQPW